MKILLLIYGCVLLNDAEGARILGIFPMAGTSHNILTSKLMKGLVAAGHDVTMISSYPMQDVPKNGKYTDVVLDGFAERFNGKWKPVVGTGLGSTRRTQNADHKNFTHQPA